MRASGAAWIRVESPSRGGRLSHGVSGGIPKHAGTQPRPSARLCASVVAARRPTLGERRSVRRKQAAGGCGSGEERNAASSSARAATAAVRVARVTHLRFAGISCFLADGSTVRPRSGCPRAREYVQPVERQTMTASGERSESSSGAATFTRSAAARTRYAI